MVLRLLQLTDLHVDMNREFVQTLIETVRTLHYDLCVLHRGLPCAHLRPFAPAASPGLSGYVRISRTRYTRTRQSRQHPMLPGMEAMGLPAADDERVRLQRDGETIYLAGLRA